MPLETEEAAPLHAQVPDWLLQGDRILRDFTFKDFREALEFVDSVGAIAEEEGHHPDIHLTSYKHVRLELSTHAIGGLSENDFILAAKVDALL